MTSSVRVAMYAKYFPPRYSGAGRQALSLAGALRERGVEIVFLTEVTPEHPRPYEQQGHPVVPVFTATPSVSLHPARCLALARYLRAREPRPRIFHAHSAYPEASAMGATARVLGLPSVLKVTLHRSDVHGHGRLIGRIHRQLLLRQSAIAAISSQIREELLELGIERARIHEIPNGVDTDRFRPPSAKERRRARHELGLPQDGPVALFVGLLSDRKNVRWMLERWRAWRGGRGASLLLVGPASEDDADPLRRSIGALVADPESGVYWRGPLDRIEQAYAATDLLLLPSQSEGMANVVLEAMAAGLPALLSDVSATRDVLGEGERTGIRFALGDAEAFEAGLDFLLRGNGSLQAIGAAARRRVEQAFSLRSVAGRYAELYAELLAEADSARSR